MRRRLTVVSATLAAIIALTACGGGADEQSARDLAGDTPVEAPAGEGAGKPDTQPGGSAAGAREPAAPVDEDAVAEPADTGLISQDVQSRAGASGQRHVISTVELTVEVEDVRDAARQAAAAATGLGGFVASEHTAGDDASTVVLRVPAQRLEDAVSRMEQLGEVTDRSRQTDDVTREVVDVASRVESQRASIARMRALLAEATRLADIISIESELARREADLDALLSQQEQLAGLTSLATLTVSLRAEREPADDDDDGFLAGLANGWDAFVSATGFALTVLGAIVPFAILAALIGVPVYLLIRRRRDRGQPAQDSGAAEVHAPSA